MCHLILLLPIIALPVFWLLPAGDASSIYAAVLVVSIGVYWLAVQAMRAPVITGIGALMHAIGTVRNVDGRKVSVWVGSELWSAEPEQGLLRVGDAIEVVGAEGLVLKVRKVGPRDDAGATAHCGAS
jgi:membrane protein implicated in regulation of membrane protease activity